MLRNNFLARQLPLLNFFIDCRYDHPYRPILTANDARYKKGRGRALESYIQDPQILWPLLVFQATMDSVVDFYNVLFFHGVGISPQITGSMLILNLADSDKVEGEIPPRSNPESSSNGFPVNSTSISVSENFLGKLITWILRHIPWVTTRPLSKSPIVFPLSFTWDWRSRCPFRCCRCPDHKHIQPLHMCQRPAASIRRKTDSVNRHNEEAKHRPIFRFLSARPPLQFYLRPKRHPAL